MEQERWTIDLPGIEMPTAQYRQPFWLQQLARFFSFVFHPLFIPLYVTWFLAFVHPSYFAGYSTTGKKRLLLLIFLNTFFFPAITVLLLKGLGFIQSVYLRTQKDRIIPYIASMTFFFWAQYVLRQQDEVPRILVGFMFGVFLASGAALIANIYFKVSMHAIGMGGFLGLLLVSMAQHELAMAWPMAAVALLAGLVCTARLLLGDHSTKEIYVGLLIGLVTQAAAAVIYAQS